MPNIKSASKRDQLEKARNLKNKADKSELRTTLKKFNAAVSEGDREAAGAAYKIAVASVDRAASKGILQKNNAARKKSSMAVKFNNIAQ